MGQGKYMEEEKRKRALLCLLLWGVVAAALAVAGNYERDGGSAPPARVAGLLYAGLGMLGVGCLLWVLSLDQKHNVSWLPCAILIVFCSVAGLLGFMYRYNQTTSDKSKRFPGVDSLWVAVGVGIAGLLLCLLLRYWKHNSE